MKPYYSDDTVALYLGDMREVLPALDVTADLVLADPPYEETSLHWDRWPEGWLDTVGTVSQSLWCFGSMRMFGERWREFGAVGWKPSQDIIGQDEDGEPVYGDVHIVWEKRNGTGFATDRFRRVHEHATHWYQGRWSDTHHEVPRVPAVFNAKGRTTSNSAVAVPHTGKIGAHRYTDDGLRLMRSVIRCPSVRRGIHRSEKPIDLLRPLIEYASPAGGLVVDPFAGSASTLDAARQLGRRAIGVEGHEPYAEKAARRLEQLTLEIA